MPTIIELEGISKHYSRQIVGVDNVSLSVEDGEFVTLLGPSGCGKSTLLRMIGGFEAPTSGRIRLDGRDVTYDPPYRRAVNMVFQDYALFPHLSVGENIAYGLKAAGTGRAERDALVTDALRQVGLLDRIDQRPHQLSGGQRQRIALARAIVKRPKVLLLDEPLSALDARLRDQMRMEIKHLHEKVGITFLMVTHDQEEALTMSDRIVVMRDGRVAQSGTPEQLYDQPATPYVANFIGTTNFLPATVVRHGEGRTVFDIGGGLIEGPANSTLAPGTAVTLGFRPEKLRLLAAWQTAANMIEGTISELIYYGLGLRLAFAPDSGHALFADTLLGESLARTDAPPPGNRVRFAIEPHNVLVFDESETP